MKFKIFSRIIFLFLLIAIFRTGYGNANTKEYYKVLYDSARNEYYKRNYAKSLEIYSELLATVKENKHTNWESSALNFMGIIYLDLLDYDKAMDYFLEVYDIAIKTSDLEAEISALGNMSLIYSEINKYDKALEYLKKAHEVALKSGNNIKIGEIVCNIVYEAMEANDTILAEQYISLVENIQTDVDELFLRAEITMIHFLLFKGDYLSAQSKALKILEKEMEPTYKIFLFFHLSKIYEHLKDLEKAIYYIYEVLKGKPTMKEKMDAYERLSELYQKDNSFALALQYKDSVLQTKDLFYKTNNKQYMEASHIQLELLNSEKQLAENRAKQKSERTIFIIVLISISILSIVLFWMFRLKSIKNKQQKTFELEKEKNEKLLLEQKLKERDALALLEQERLTNEIEIKNKQLTARVLFQSNRSNLIKELIAAFSNASLQEQNPAIDSVIQKLKLQLKDSADANNFLAQLDQINPSLFLLLKEKYPNLSIDEIQLLSYIYLYNTDTKKIVSLLDMSVNTCQKRKERLAAKMGIKTTELYDLLYDLMREAVSG